MTRDLYLKAQTDLMCGQTQCLEDFKEAMEKRQKSEEALEEETNKTHILPRQQNPGLTTALTLAVCRL